MKGRLAVSRQRVSEYIFNIGARFVGESVADNATNVQTAPLYLLREAEKLVRLRGPQQYIRYTK